jgi:hypothetical protein
MGEILNLVDKLFGGLAGGDYVAVSPIGCHPGKCEDLGFICYEDLTLRSK